MLIKKFLKISREILLKFYIVDYNLIVDIKEELRLGLATYAKTLFIFLDHFNKELKKSLLSTDKYHKSSHFYSKK